MTKLPVVAEKVDQDLRKSGVSISVVIANYNRCADLRQALTSVRRQEWPDVEVLVVDNASTDDSRSMVEREFLGARLVALRENLGMGGYSEGFALASGDILFQMDNDSLLPDPKTLSEVACRFAEGPPNLAAVACRVEEWREGETSIESLAARDDRRGPIRTGGFHSGGVGFRRGLLEGTGYYSREVFLYGSELFLQMKLLARGLEVSYFPEILVLHKSSTVERSAVGLYFELRNRYWFMRRFATAAQRLRYLPSMLLYDFVYALGRRRLRAFAKAVWDGFGRLPSELRQSIRSHEPDFLAKIDEVGTRFGLSSLVHSIGKQLTR